MTTGRMTVDPQSILRVAEAEFNYGDSSWAVQYMERCFPGMEDVVIHGLLSGELAYEIDHNEIVIY